MRTQVGHTANHLPETRFAETALECRSTASNETGIIQYVKYSHLCPESHAKIEVKLPENGSRGRFSRLLLFPQRQINR